MKQQKAAKQTTVESSKMNLIRQSPKELVTALFGYLQKSLDIRLGNLERAARQRRHAIDKMQTQTKQMIHAAEELLQEKNGSTRQLAMSKEDARQSTEDLFKGRPVRGRSNMSARHSVDRSIHDLAESSETLAALKTPQEIPWNGNTRIESNESKKVLQIKPPVQKTISPTAITSKVTQIKHQVSLPLPQDSVADIEVNQTPTPNSNILCLPTMQEDQATHLPNAYSSTMPGVKSTWQQDKIIDEPTSACTRVTVDEKIDNFCQDSQFACENCGHHIKVKDLLMKACGKDELTIWSDIEKKKAELVSLLEQVGVLKSLNVRQDSERKVTNAFSPTPSPRKIERGIQLSKDGRLYSASPSPSRKTEKIYQGYHARTMKGGKGSNNLQDTDSNSNFGAQNPFKDTLPNPLAELEESLVLSQIPTPNPVNKPLIPYLKDYSQNGQNYLPKEKSIQNVTNSNVSSISLLSVKENVRPHPYLY
jgi:hypothetical protein